MDETNNQIERVQPHFSEYLKEDTILWFITSNQQINCGKVMSHNVKTKEVTVFNFDEWSIWTISYDMIVRISIKYFTDLYMQWTNQIKL